MIEIIGYNVDGEYDFKLPSIEGINVKSQKVSKKRKFGPEDIILTSVGIVAGIPVGVLVNYLWDIIIKKINYCSTVEVIFSRKTTIEIFKETFEDSKENILISITEELKKCKP